VRAALLEQQRESEADGAPADDRDAGIGRERRDVGGGGGGAGD
jgi:hypothetical protein